MHSDEPDLVEIVLGPGEHFVGDARHRICTLLGSCVSITLWHPRYRIGAMSHFLLPSRADGAGQVLDGRYGEEVMCILLRKLAAVHVEPRECVGKIFGGGNMFPLQSRADARNVGVKNGEAARALLRAHKIPIVSESLFGIGHRQIIFDVRSGDVWARQANLVIPDGLNQ
ncbi:MAG: chemotaxis protein CheD [Burkholderiaceae bacterium]|nr:chemotaxis protein CheD [Burkholderiaceae bacterium]